MCGEGWGLSSLLSSEAIVSQSPSTPPSHHTRIYHHAHWSTHTMMEDRFVAATVIQNLIYSDVSASVERPSTPSTPGVRVVQFRPFSKVWESGTLLASSITFPSGKSIVSREWIHPPPLIIHSFIAAIQSLPPACTHMTPTTATTTAIVLIHVRYTPDALKSCVHSCILTACSHHS